MRALQRALTNLPVLEWSPSEAFGRQATCVASGRQLSPITGQLS
ncbi:hypothetical protein A2U01_0086948, partial [Trifolium medium]|nr:hypothetical protein [Trifolium medium]